MLHVIINTDNEEEVLAQRVEQSLHGGNGGACGNEIVEDDEVRFSGEHSQIELHSDTLPTVRDGHILVVGDLQPAAYLSSYSACKVLGEVPSLWGGTDSPMPISEVVTEHTLDNGCKVVSKIGYHRIIGFNVC